MSFNEFMVLLFFDMLLLWDLNCAVGVPEMREGDLNVYSG